MYGNEFDGLLAALGHTVESISRLAEAMTYYYEDVLSSMSFYFGNIDYFYVPPKPYWMHLARRYDKPAMPKLYLTRVQRNLPYCRRKY